LGPDAVRLCVSLAESQLMVTVQSGSISRTTTIRVMVEAPGAILRDCDFNRKTYKQQQT